MKRVSICAIFIVLCNLSFSANAAVAPKPLKQLAEVDPSATGLVSSKDQLLVYGNHEKSGFTQFVNGAPIELNCGVESFVSAATADSQGNFYLVGAASNPVVGTLPPITGILNPDNVVPDPVSSNKSDASTLCYWKLDATGKIIDSNTIAMPSAIIPNSVLVDKYGITIAGAIYANPGFSGFVMNLDSKLTTLGKNSTQVFSLVRAADGSTIAIGQSSEKLLDKNLKGLSDGFLAKISNGKLVSVQRSSDFKSNRAWRSATNNLLLGGFSNSSAVITKFALNFNPIWTTRFPAIGSALTAVSGKVSYGAFVSNGPIKAIPTWKRKNSILILAFDAKGAIIDANYLNSSNINGFAANSTYGAILLSGGFLYRA